MPTSHSATTAKRVRHLRKGAMISAPRPILKVYSGDRSVVIYKGRRQGTIKLDVRSHQRTIAGAPVHGMTGITDWTIGEEHDLALQPPKLSTFG